MSASHSGGANGHFGQPLAPRTSETIADNDGNVDARLLLQLAPQPRCGPVGSAGSRTACWPPSTFETSTPLFAQMNPCLVSVISTFRLRRTMRRLSRSANSCTRHRAQTFAPNFATRPMELPPRAPRERLPLSKQPYALSPEYRHPENIKPNFARPPTTVHSAIHQHESLR